METSQKQNNMAVQAGKSNNVGRRNAILSAFKRDRSIPDFPFCITLSPYIGSPLAKFCGTRNLFRSELICLDGGLIPSLQVNCVLLRQITTWSNSPVSSSRGITAAGTYSLAIVLYLAEKKKNFQDPYRLKLRDNSCTYLFVEVSVWIIVVWRKRVLTYLSLVFSNTVNTQELGAREEPSRAQAQFTEDVLHTSSQ